MGRLNAVLRRVRSAGVMSSGLAVLFLLTLSPTLQSQESASLRGSVRDSEGKPVAGATVKLRANGTSQTQTAHSDSHGNYSFAVLQGGAYVLRAEMAGYGDAEIPPLSLGPKEAKTVDLILPPANQPASQPASPRAPTFFDQPQFTVAGVTDTTTTGSHGSDTTARTRDTLAKETVSLGNALTDTGRGAASESEKSLRESVEHDPDSFEANHRLGKVLAENGRAREAIPYLERAGELKAGDYENAYELALANESAGNYQRARDTAQTLLPRFDKAEVHHLLGDVQEKLGNSLESVREYQRAVELDPSETYIFDWGSELLLHRAPEPAAEVFAQGNRLYPRSARMPIGLGAAWFAQGSFALAVQKICEASDLNPNDSIPYRFLGTMLEAETPPSQEAVEKLRRFVERQPNNAEANYYYAVGLWKLRTQPQDAASAAQVESLLRRAIHLDPKYGAAYLQLGILHSEHNDYPAAIADFQQAIQADPQREQVHYRLAQAYRHVGDVAKEKAELKEYDQAAKKSAQQVERERHEIPRFVYTLRDQPVPQSP
jgi:tetratricopeptide (TPR) repeat protein